MDFKAVNGKMHLFFFSNVYMEILIHETGYDLGTDY